MHNTMLIILHLQPPLPSLFQNATLQHYSGFAEMDLKESATQLHEHHQKAVEAKLQAIREKYSHQRMGNVGKIDPLSDAEFAVHCSFNSSLAPPLPPPLPPLQLPHRWSPRCRSVARRDSASCYHHQHYPLRVHLMAAETCWIWVRHGFSKRLTEGLY